MSVKTEIWGKAPDGRDVRRFTMTNAMGASVSVIEWGAILQSIIVPDAGGNMDDVALGFDSLDRYLAPHGSMGDTVGRYGNRIGAGRFTLDGVEYQLALNDHGINHLHGGKAGFSSDGFQRDRDHQRRDFRLQASGTARQHSSVALRSHTDCGALLGRPQERNTGGGLA